MVKIFQDQLFLQTCGDTSAESFIDDNEYQVDLPKINAQYFVDQLKFDAVKSFNYKYVCPFCNAKTSANTAVEETIKCGNSSCSVITKVLTLKKSLEIQVLCAGLQNNPYRINFEDLKRLDSRFRDTEDVFAVDENMVIKAILDYQGLEALIDDEKQYVAFP